MDGDPGRVIGTLRLRLPHALICPRRDADLGYRSHTSRQADQELDVPWRVDAVCELPVVPLPARGQWTDEVTWDRAFSSGCATSVTELASLAASLTTHGGSRPPERAEGSPDDPTSRRVDVWPHAARERDSAAADSPPLLQGNRRRTLHQSAHGWNTHHLDQ